KFVFAEVPGSPSECTLEYAKPNLFKIDTPDRLTVSDGKKVWNLNKAAKTYTESDVNLKRTTERDVLPWAAFFAKDAYDGAKSFSPGPKLTVRGVDVQAFAVNLADGSNETLYLDAASGAAVGAAVVKKDTKTLTTTTSFKLNDDPFPDTEFAFTPPADAKKVEDAPPAASYAAVNEIFKVSCAGCHSASRAAGGLDLSSYDSMMRGGNSGKAV